MQMINKYFLSAKICLTVSKITTPQKRAEQRTANLGIAACRENANHGSKPIPFPVSSPKSTAFCHRMTPPLGNNADPNIKIFPSGTFLNKSTSRNAPTMGEYATKKLGLIPVQITFSRAKITHSFQVIPFRYFFSNLK